MNHGTGSNCQKTASRVPVSAGNLARVRVRPAAVADNVANASSNLANASQGKVSRARINLPKINRANRKRDNNLATSRVKVSNRVNNQVSSRDNSQPAGNGRGAVNNRVVNSLVAGNLEDNNPVRRRTASGSLVIRRIPTGNKAAKAMRGGQRGNPGGPRRLDTQTGAGNGPAAGDRTFAPIAGGDFLNWSDRLRDVEEMVDDPELRAEAARIRDRARSIRAELKRHSTAPNWDLVRMQVAEPLVELTDRVAEEVLRRNSRQAIVPLDRDPVPPKYSEKTRKYYEQLGTGK